MSLSVQEGARSVRAEIIPRPGAARTALLLLGSIWAAFAVVWTILVLAAGGSVLLALASLAFVPAGLFAAARVLARMPERWVLELDADRGLVAVRRGFLSRGRVAVPLADLADVEVESPRGTDAHRRPALKVATRTGDVRICEGHARLELERLAAVLKEGVRSARSSPP